MRNLIAMDEQKNLVTKTFRSALACRKEAHILTLLKGSGLVPELFSHEDRSVVMAKLPGKTLRQLPKDLKKEDVLAIFKAAAEGLLKLQSYAFQTCGKVLLLHDLTPGNILLSDCGKAMFLDFEAADALSQWTIEDCLQSFGALLSMSRSFQQQSLDPEALFQSLLTLFAEELPKRAFCPKALQKDQQQLRAALARSSEKQYAADRHRRALRPYLKNTEAFVAAGGRSSRMGGFPKGLLKLGEDTFCDRILYALQPFDKVRISANREEYSAFGLSVIPDSYEEIGPLSAIYSALSTAGSEFVFLCPCDMPLLDEEALLAPLQPEHFQKDAVIYKNDHSPIPILGFYRRSVLDMVLARIQAEDYRLMHLLNSLDYAVIEPAEPFKFRNINTPEELEEILSLN